MKSMISLLVYKNRLLETQEDTLARPRSGAAMTATTRAVAETATATTVAAKEVTTTTAGAVKATSAAVAAATARPVARRHWFK
jgi:hypothetical protein